MVAVGRRGDAGVELVEALLALHEHDLAGDDGEGDGEGEDRAERDRRTGAEAAAGPDDLEGRTPGSAAIGERDGTAATLAGGRISGRGGGGDGERGPSH